MRPASSRIAAKGKWQEEGKWQEVERTIYDKANLIEVSANDIVCAIREPRPHGMAATSEAAAPAESDAPTATAPAATADSRFVATISCPNGTTIELVVNAAEGNAGTIGNGTTFVILGRGRCGIPASAVHVSRSAASVRIVDMNCSREDEPSSSCYGLELAVVGSQPCRVNRRPGTMSDGEDTATEDSTSTIQVSSPLSNNDYGRSTILLRDGDTIEPYLRAEGDALDDFKKAEKYLPFKVRINNGECAGSNTNSGQEAHVIADAAVPQPKSINESQDTVSVMVEKKIQAAQENGGQIETKGDDPTLTKDVEPSSKSPKTTASSQGMSSSESEQSSEEDDEEDIEFPRERVLEILEGVDSPGSFAAGGSCGGKLIMPGIEVDGVGTIGLPLSESQAKLLATRCEQAPFGRGTETIVDTTVRRTFQLAPEHFKITNPTWSGQISNLVSGVCRDLGVQAHLKVEAQLYKLLLYEKGSFFKMHRDSEKVDGMFGTLVIILPTAFTGGELIVKHQGKTKEFAQSNSSTFESSYAAFYADCKHELKPVTSGHRLCLVYNLVKTGAGSTPHAQRNRHVLRQLKSAVDAWSKSFDGNKLVIMTEHLYTPAGMGAGGSSAKYKGNDAAIVGILEQAVEEGSIDIDWDHGTLSYSESGYAEDDGYYGRWGGGGFTWSETTDSHMSLALSDWGNVDISSDEIIPEDYWEDKEPEDETFEPTGNEGVSAERQYADEDAIVVWPRSQRWIIVTNNSTPKMCEYLLRACTPGTGDSEGKDECAEKARKIISRITSSRGPSRNQGYSSYSHRSGDTQSNVTTLVKALTRLGDKSLMVDFLQQYIAANPASTPDFLLEEILPVAVRFGVDTIRPLLLSAIDSQRCSVDTTKTALFVLKSKKALQSTALATDVVIHFIGVISPEDIGKRPTPVTCLDQFPVKDLVDLFHGNEAIDGGKLLAKSLFSYLNWATGLSMERPRNTWSTATTTIPPKGPTVLLRANLAGLVDFFQAWEEFEPILMDAAKGMCAHGSRESAIEFVDMLTGQPKSSIPTDSVKNQVCGRVATLVCEDMLAAQPPSSASPELLLSSYKRLFLLLARYSPSKAEQFLFKAQNLDMDKVLLPLVLDDSTRNGVIASSETKQCLDSLTKHCADVLSNRTRDPLGSVEVWSLHPSISIPQNSLYSSFLKNPCKQVLDWQVRKSDHKGFFAELSPLIRAGEVKADSYQPAGRGPYHFRITKLKRRSMPALGFAAMTCSCASRGSSSSYGRSNYRQYSSATTSSNCLLKKYKATVEKRKQDEKALATVIALLPPELREQLGTRKRQASVAASANDTTGAVDLTASPDRSQSVVGSVPTAAAQSSKKSKQTDANSDVIDLT